MRPAPKRSAILWPDMAARFVGLAIRSEWSPVIYPAVGLVCLPCNDRPQQQLRTIVLPARSLPIMNPRPELYVTDDNPMSAIGVSANFALPQYGSPHR